MSCMVRLCNYLKNVLPRNPKLLQIFHNFDWLLESETIRKFRESALFVENRRGFLYTKINGNFLRYIFKIQISFVQRLA